MRWIIVVLLNLLIIEGLVFALFPRKMILLIGTAPTWVLRLAGILEVLVGAALIAMLLGLEH